MLHDALRQAQIGCISDHVETVARECQARLDRLDEGTTRLRVREERGNIDGLTGQERIDWTTRSNHERVQQRAGELVNHGCMSCSMLAQNRANGAGDSAERQ